MDQKEKFDALMRQAEFNIKRFDERRGYSWKIALGIWGAILGSAAIFADIRPTLFLVLLFPFLLTPIILHAVWLKGVFNANDRDKVKAFNATREAYRLAEMKYKNLKHKQEKWHHNWSVQFQLAMTGTLSVGAIVFNIVRIANHFLKEV